ncbi:MAG TPA: nitrile hydratase accessory protein [Acetobacteraceae bacterium]|nr:nitrile hydratase accessory protein [Acetobacteraceae bacterium]
MTATGLPTGAAMPALPMDEQGPVFREPWEAQAFAIVLKLYQGGHFTWPEWVEHLSAEIRAAQRDGDRDGYYRHWLGALEKIVAAKNLVPGSELLAREAEIAANPPDRHGHVARREPVTVA